MIGTSKIISTSRDKFNRLVAKIIYIGKIINGKGDIRTAIESSSFGIDSNPTEGKVAIYAQSRVKGKYYVIGYLNTNRLAEVGETRLFSTDTDGQLQAYVWLRNQGNILELNGADDNAVLFNKLKIEFNELKSKHNAFLTEYQSHVHSGVIPGGGASGPTVSTQTPSTANIDNAKNSKIKTNS